MPFITPHNKAVMSILCWLRRCLLLSHPCARRTMCRDQPTLWIWLSSLVPAPAPRSEGKESPDGKVNYLQVGRLTALMAKLPRVLTGVTP